MPSIIEVTDFSSPELDIYARLSEAQLSHIYEPDTGLFIAESPKVVERAMDAGYVPVSVLLERKHIDGEAHGIINRIHSLYNNGDIGDVPIYTAPFDVLTKLTGFQLTRGMLCAMKRKTLPSVDDVCQNAKRIVVLENVVNPTNVGAIFRCAAALGMDGVLLTKGCSDPLYRRSERVSMGTVFQIPWTYIDSDRIYQKKDKVHQDLSCIKMYDTSSIKSESYLSHGTLSEYKLSEKSPVLQNKSDTSHWIDIIKGLGFKTAAMALLDDSVNIDHPALNSEERLAIIMGTEGDGLATDTIARCDYTVCIPMHHGVDSLNVAAASAIAFWQLGNHLS